VLGFDFSMRKNHKLHKCAPYTLMNNIKRPTLRTRSYDFDLIIPTLHI